MLSIRKIKSYRSNFILIIAISCLYPALGQNNLVGKWAPQHYEYTCWAASLANLTNVEWIKEGSISERTLAPQDQAMELNDLGIISYRYFNFRHLEKDSILSYEGINSYLRYKYPRPLIYSYSYETEKGSGSGHYVNIVGCYCGDKISEPNKRWLTIYDPLPQGIGATYLKNYECYRIIDKYSNGLDGTFFNYVKNDLPLPDLVSKDREKAILNNVYKCDDCFSDIDPTMIKVTLQDPLFSTYVGTNIQFPKSWKFDMVTLMDSVRDNKNDLITVEKKNGSIFIINYDGNKTLKGGTTLKKINSKNKYLIDRVEDISKYDDLKAYFQKPNTEMVVTKGQFRFLKFKENNELKYLDMDKVFVTKDSTNRIHSEKEFIRKIKPEYLKVSEGGRKIIEACQKLVAKTDSTCFYYGLNKDTTFCRNSVVPAKYLFPSEEKLLGFVPFVATYYSLPKDDAERHKFLFRIQSYKDTVVNKVVTINNVTTIKKDTLGFPVRGKDTACLTCYPPKPIYYPYLSSNGNMDILLIKTSNYPSIKKLDYPEQSVNWNLLADKAIPTDSIMQISSPRLESFNGYMNTIEKGKKRLNDYTSKMSAKGIICDVLLKTGEIIQCYVFCNEDSNDPKGRFQWKE